MSVDEERDDLAAVDAFVALAGLAVVVEVADDLQRMEQEQDLPLARAAAVVGSDKLVAASLDVGAGEEVVACEPDVLAGEVVVVSETPNVAADYLPPLVVVALCLVVVAGDGPGRPAQHAEGEGQVAQVVAGIPWAAVVHEVDDMETLEADPLDPGEKE